MATAPRKTANDARVRNTAQSPQDEERAGRNVTADAQRTELDGTSGGMSRADRLRMIRDEFRQEALPQPPAIPGWHLCWLSTTSQWDTIVKRQRLGYEPVKAEELPGFNADRMNTGAFEGAVSCNEMVLFKIPQDIYEMIMREFHHDQPLREEENLKAQLKRGNVDSSGRELEEVEGFEDLAVKRPAPAHYA